MFLIRLLIIAFVIIIIIAAWQMITQGVIGLSDILNIYPPPSGAVDPLPSPSESPYQGKRVSHHDSPVHSPSPNTATTT